MNTKLLIGGRLVTGEGTAEAVLDAATGAEIASVPSATVAQVEQAVQAAEAAFPDWARSAPKDRAAAASPEGLRHTPAKKRKTSAIEGISSLRAAASGLPVLRDSSAA